MNKKQIEQKFNKIGQSLFNKNDFINGNTLSELQSDVLNYLEKLDNLEKENRRMIVGEFTSIKLEEIIKNNYISKQKIQDKIANLKLAIYKGDNAPQDFLQYRVKAKIQVLQELLEEE